ncbi:hypothetical protein VTK26DRAFT_3477 [Humicola hyalothermophila]
MVAVLGPHKSSWIGKHRTPIDRSDRSRSGDNRSRGAGDQSRLISRTDDVLPTPTSAGISTTVVPDMLYSMALPGGLVSLPQEGTEGPLAAFVGAKAPLVS